MFGVDANNVAASVQKREFDAGNLGPGVKPRDDLRIDPNKGEHLLLMPSTARALLRRGV